jgi:hypothetical protein
MDDESGAKGGRFGTVLGENKLITLIIHSKIVICNLPPHSILTSTLNWGRSQNRPQFIPAVSFFINVWSIGMVVHSDFYSDGNSGRKSNVNYSNRTVNKASKRRSSRIPHSTII